MIVLCLNLLYHTKKFFKKESYIIERRELIGKQNWWPYIVKLAFPLRENKKNYLASLAITQKIIAYFPLTNIDF